MKASFVHKTSALWMASGLILGVALPVIAQPLTEGRIECSSVVQWHSTCEQPEFDVDAHHGSSGLRDAQLDFSAYQSCLVREAQDDARVMQKGIIDGAQTELRSVEGHAAIWGFTVQ